MPDEQTPTHTWRNSFAKSPRMNFGRSGGRQSMVMLIWNNLYANCLHFWVVSSRLARELSFLGSQAISVIPS